jgi:hypothetical protein
MGQHLQFHLHYRLLLFLCFAFYYSGHVAFIKTCATRDSFERSLVRFLKSVKMTPDNMVAKAKSQPSGTEKTLILFISRENEGSKNER